MVFELRRCCPDCGGAAWHYLNHAKIEELCCCNCGTVCNFDEMVNSAKLVAKKEYAEIAWSIEDILLFHDDWTDEQCAEWWEENEKWFADALIEYGNSLICSKL